MRTRFIIPILLWASLAASSHSAAATSAGETESQLRQIRERIERVSHELGASAVARDREGARLHDSELAVSATHQALDRLTQQQRDTRAERDRIAAERAAVERDLTAQRTALGAQLRLAHRLNRIGPLQFLLSQSDPWRAGRLLNFYGYFGRARAEQIATIREHTQRIDLLDVQLEAAEAGLIKLTEERQLQLAAYESQRNARATVLAALNRDAQDKKQMLVRLKSQQAELETLLRDLTRALRDSPPPPQVLGLFASLRGKLAWPAAGSLLARFGQQRATGVKWEGVLLATERAAAVRAVAAGRVVYADWLPGLGLLTIIDHGNGYMSLYGHNDTLRSAAGNLVRAGDVIADAGDTGGSSRPVLYFEIRQNGRPVDPLPWFTSARPN